MFGHSQQIIFFHFSFVSHSYKNAQTIITSVTKLVSDSEFLFNVVQTKNGELYFEDWSEHGLLVVWFSSLGCFVTQGP